MNGERDQVETSCRVLKDDGEYESSEDGIISKVRSLCATCSVFEGKHKAAQHDGKNYNLGSSHRTHDHRHVVSE